MPKLKLTYFDFHTFSIQDEADKKAARPELVAGPLTFISNASHDASSDPAASTSPTVASPSPI